MDGLGWLVGASCIGGAILACLVSFFLATLGAICGLFWGTFLTFLFSCFFSLARGFQYIDTIGDLYIDHFSLYR